MQKAALCCCLLILYSSLAPAAPSRSAETLEKVMKSGPYYPRAMAVTQIGDHLTDSERDQIFLFLANKTKGQLTSLEINSLKNDLVIVLTRQTRREERLTDALIAMYRDREHDPVWRDYCLQFLGRTFPEMPLPEKKRAALALADALSDSNANTAATAMIAVNANRTSPEMPVKEMRQKAFELASAGNAPSSARSTAIQIGAENHDQRLLPLIRTLIHSDATSVPVKMSALAALGKLGTAADQELLVRYAATSEVRLSAAAAAALKQMKFTKQ